MTRQDVTKAAEPETVLEVRLHNCYQTIMSNSAHYTLTEAMRQINYLLARCNAREGLQVDLLTPPPERMEAGETAVLRFSLRADMFYPGTAEEAPQ